MKRRKTLNKYTIGEHGQITNNNPTLSPRTQKLLELMTFAQTINALSSVELSDDEEEYVVDDKETYVEKMENNE